MLSVCSKNACVRKTVIAFEQVSPDSFASYSGTRIAHALAYCKGVDQRARLALSGSNHPQAV
jgi:hypothetical protein